MGSGAKARGEEARPGMQSVFGFWVQKRERKPRTARVLFQGCAIQGPPHSLGGPDPRT